MLKKPFTLIDLTHPLENDTPTWGGGCGFDHIMHTDYDPKAPYSFRTHKIRMHEGIGTHIDAPAHCIPGGKTIDQLDLNDFIAPCVVINVSAHRDERYTLAPEDILAFEDQYAPLPPRSFVIIYTGWSEFWGNREKYRNNLVFPNISAAAAELLLTRDIVGVGIDTLSPDRPEAGFPVHTLLLGAGKYIIENIANALQLPPTGAYTLALPLNIQGGTEAPLRLVGITDLTPHATHGNLLYQSV